MLETQPSPCEVTGGIDTHADTHTVAALDGLGHLLGHATFPANRVGYEELLGWLTSHGDVARSVWRAPAPTALAWPAT